MKRSFIALLFIMVSGNTLFAQKGKALPPDYLIGQSLPDSVMQMQLENLAGDMVPFKTILEEHKGSNIVIDYWASWCRDCIVGLPDLNELMANTVDREVKYVFISVDKEKSKWKNAIDHFHIEGDHYRTVQGWKSPLSNYIVLDWIPRYMVIDENGTVELPKTVKASDNALRELLMGEN